ncbi:MAG: MurT ligase domain-containing protein [Bifidobacterium minimum]|jgi:UDP-N-acetylmuramyl tripeptide synthase|nr:MurT ligase domain-containing protein [Bifidobacterium minimum]
MAFAPMGVITPAVGRMASALSRLTRHGGSAFPGLVAERIDPGFLSRTLDRLPCGVVLVSGTNGKTTTTRMIATMLEELGLRVFTNPTGSNFTRGVVSALLGAVDLRGRLDADIAVLELDEAYAVRFVAQVRPRYAVLLNVLRDQLDRFGEIDHTADLLGRVAAATTGVVVLNREDPRIAALASRAATGVDVRYFGLEDKLRPLFPSDDDMHAGDGMHADDGTDTADAADDTDAADGMGGVGDAMPLDVTVPTGGASASEDVAVPAGRTGAGRLPADVTLVSVGDHEATFMVDGVESTTDVRLEGVYNLFNACAALTVVRAVMRELRSTDRIVPVSHGTGSMTETGTGIGNGNGNGNASTSVASPYDDEIMRALSTVTPAFGRGESIDVDGTPVELLLVKNPMGFRLSLASFPPQGHDTMIAICDEYADGRDMSWLWDVDFRSLRDSGVAMVSGTRAWDMALRLDYDEVPIGDVDTDLESAVGRFVRSSPGTPKHLYCTYTAMLRARSVLSRVASVADAGVGR